MEYLAAARRREYRVQGAGSEAVVLGWAGDGNLCLAETRLWTSATGRLQIERRRTCDGQWVQTTTTFAGDRWETVATSVITWSDDDQREWTSAVQEADVGAIQMELEGA